MVLPVLQGAVELGSRTLVVRRARLKLLVMASLFVLSGCATNPLPDGYDGRSAYVGGTMTHGPDLQVTFTGLEKVNGTAVRGLFMTQSAMFTSQDPRVIEREVPAREAVFTIQGKQTYTLPAKALVKDMYAVEGDVTFAPMPGHRYVVVGTFSKEYAAVWIEDREAPNVVVGQKVEVRGDTSVPFWKK